jgi:lysozyme family protein
VIETRIIWQDVLFSKAVEGGYSAPRPGDRHHTNLGVTLETLQRWRAPNLVTVEDLKNLTLDEAKAIASANYWNKVQADKLPGGVDLLAGDFAFNSGPQQAVRTLQRCVGLVGSDVDGFMGPVTLNACLKANPRSLIRTYVAARLAFMQGLDTWEQNKGGWQERLVKMEDLALHLAPEQGPIVTAKNAASTTKIVANVSIAGTAIAMVQPVVEAIPAAKTAYGSLAELLGPYEIILPGITLGIGALVIVGILYGKARASRMSKAAVTSGAVEVAVA